MCNSNFHKEYSNIYILYTEFYYLFKKPDICPIVQCISMRTPRIWKFAVRIHSHTAWRAFSVRDIENGVQNGAEKVLMGVVIMNVEEILELVSQATGIKMNSEKRPLQIFAVISFDGSDTS